jgi:ribosomal protein S18 acetylase RimI-like enzyme
MSIDGIEFSPPDAATAEALPPVARKIFTDAFAQFFDREAFEAFCDRAYAKEGPMAKDLKDPEVFWQVATCSGMPIGYAKLTPLRAPASSARPGAMELQQIYVLAQWHGAGVAEKLMRWAVSVAERELAPELYLTVFDHNERAKRFYARHGFEEVGHCTFTLGGHAYDDRIWCKRLAPAQS